MGIFERALGLATENMAAEPGYVSCLGGNVCSPRRWPPRTCLTANVGGPSVKNKLPTAATVDAPLEAVGILS